MAPASARAGRHVTGPAVQRKTWNLAALFRLPTGKGQVWLKTTARFAADEASVIAAFARVDPALVPPVIGAGPRRVRLCWGPPACPVSCRRSQPIIIGVTVSGFDMATWPVPSIRCTSVSVRPVKTSVSDWGMK